MKVDKGRTIMNGKDGNIAYESLANPKHVVGTKRPENQDERVLTVKFEERFKGRDKVPAKTIMGLCDMGKFTPFSYSNGQPKYGIYNFNKQLMLAQTSNTKKILNGLISLAKKVGLTLAFKEFNQKKDLVRKLRKLEHKNPNVLDKYWQASFRKFMGNS